MSVDNNLNFKFYHTEPHYYCSTLRTVLSSSFFLLSVSHQRVRDVTVWVAVGHIVVQMLLMRL